MKFGGIELVVVVVVVVVVVEDETPSYMPHVSTWWGA